MQLWRAKTAYDSGHAAAEEALRHAKHEANSIFGSSERKNKAKLAERTWETNTVFEATHNAPKLQLAEEKKEIKTWIRHLEEILKRADEQLERFRFRSLSRPMAQEPASVADAAEPARPKLQPAVERAAEVMRSLDASIYPKLLAGGAPIGLALAVWGAWCGLAVLVLGTAHWLAAVIIGSVLAAGCDVAGGIAIYRRAKAAIAPRYEALHDALAQCQELCAIAREQAKSKCTVETQKIIDRRDTELKAARDKFDERTQEIASARRGA